MSANTSIEWCDRSWNPVRGCSIVSPGCVNCYAMKQAHRFSGDGKPYDGLTKQTKAGPQWTGKIRTVDAALLEPLSWRKPARVFVNSMSDLFHEGVPDEFIAEVFGVMAACGAKEHGDGCDHGLFGAKWDRAKGIWRESTWKGPHTFQVLTKRPARMQALLTSPKFRQAVADAAYRRAHNQRDAGYLAHQIGEREEYSRCYPPGRMWPLSNVWLGVSVENQQYADERIPLLLRTPAAVRFISAEPLLGPVDLTSVGPANANGAHGFDALRVWQGSGPRLDWVIVGGESGPSARAFDIAWARSIVQQCKAAGVACFVKQLGREPYTEGAVRQNAAHQGPGTHREHIGHVLRDKKGGDPSEWPDDLRVREFPEARP